MDPDLSQNEINDLLNESENSNDEENKAEPSQPKTIDLFDRETTVYGKIKTLSVVNEIFERFFEENLSLLIKNKVKIKNEGIKLYKYKEYISSLEPSVNINIINVVTFSGNGLIVIDPLLLSNIIDGFFGGKGGKNKTIERNELSETEVRIIKLLLEAAIESIKMAWIRIIELKLEIAKIDKNSALSSHFDPFEMIVVSKFLIDVNDETGFFHVCFPSEMIDRMRGRAHAIRGKNKEKINKEWVEDLRSNIVKSKIEVNCTLAEREINLSEVMKFKVNDVVFVNIPDKIVLKSNKEKIFTGKFGVFDGKYAVKISEKIEKQ